MGVHRHQKCVQNETFESELGGRPPHRANHFRGLSLQFLDGSGNVRSFDRRPLQSALWKMSFANLIRGIRESGVRQWWRDLNCASV